MDSNGELPADAPVPRLCHLYKWADFDGFGFNLQVGHFIGKVDDESPAQYADLREGDRIIEVNGVPISNENHKQVVQRIKTVPDETHLLVIEANAYQWYKDRNLIIRSTQANVVHCRTPVPRPHATNDQSTDEHQMNGKIETSTNESANVSLNASTNLSTKESITTSASSSISEHKSEFEKVASQDSPLADEILSALETKQNASNVNEIANKLESTKLQSEASNTIESNNNSEKAANQNLVSSSAVVKSHNFIVVNSEEDFAAEKRLKDEQMRNSERHTTSTPIKMDSKSSDSNNQSNLSTSSISSTSTANHLATSNKKDLNLNMSASEMRKLIASRRNVKAECKKIQMDLKQKYEIIQQM